MTHPPTLFHSLLRPVVLQILRAQGYHGARTSATESLTDLTARFLYALSEATANHMVHNGHAEPDIVDLRLAMEDCGILLPDVVFEQEEFRGVEDTRPVDDFVLWAAGPKVREMKRVALDGEEDTDYLNSMRALIHSYQIIVFTRAEELIDTCSNHEETQQGRGGLEI